MGFFFQEPPHDLDNVLNDDEMPKRYLTKRYGNTLPPKAKDNPKVISLLEYRLQLSLRRQENEYGE